MNLDFIRCPLERCVRVSEEEWRRNHQRPRRRKAAKSARKKKLEEFERRYWRELLRKHKGCVVAAAKEAGVARATAYKQLLRYSIDASPYRRRKRQEGNAAWQALSDD